MQPETGAHLWDAAEAARLIGEFGEGKREGDFNSDLLLRSAIERQLEILGEALSRLRRDDPTTAARVPDFEKVIGMRNIIAHEYGQVDYEIVWQAATIQVPALMPVLGELLDEAKGLGTDRPKL